MGESVTGESINGESVNGESASFVDESVIGGRPADEFLGLEPEGDLLGRRLG